ncbi:hypothetical protein CC2G_006605 [Coprinopsis cinerea AmutBmut pab1-1]|nr:hypothetical protein CC2G_006605 [Coprinopsis cinerea AmutBmut pab1-1]
MPREAIRVILVVWAITIARIPSLYYPKNQEVSVGLARAGWHGPEVLCVASVTLPCSFWSSRSTRMFALSNSSVPRVELFRVYNRLGVTDMDKGTE